MNKLESLPQWEGFYEDYRYKIAHSGRGAGKSMAAIIALLFFASRAKLRIFCLREFQANIADSVKAEIEKCIRLSGTEDAWLIHEQYIKHKITGSTFRFRGLQNSRGLKSLSDADIAFIEEAEDISPESWQNLVPSIRKPKSEVWACLNPKSRTSVMAKTFMEAEILPPDTLIMTSSYLENPLLNPDQVLEAQHMLDTNPTLYRHVWLGHYLDDSNTTMVTNVRIGDAECFPHEAVVVGIDVAEEGGDRCVFCIRQGKTIKDLWVFDTITQDQLVEETHKVIRMYSPDRVNVDSTGFGNYVPGMFKGHGIQVCGVNFAKSAIKEDIYHNRRTELCGTATEFFDAGGSIPKKYSDLALEIDASTYTLDTRRRFQLLPKKVMKKKLGKSPDLADAFYLSLYNPNGMFCSKSAEQSAQLEVKLMAHTLVKRSKWVS